MTYWDSICKSCSNRVADPRSL